MWQKYVFLCSLRKTITLMKDILYTIGDLFEATFEILEAAGNVPNVLIIIVGTAALAFCMKVVTTDKNICE
jgi:hypothetical protein